MTFEPAVTGVLGENESLLDYSMTKGGIHAFAQLLATNRRVNAVARGPLWTPQPDWQGSERWKQARLTRYDETPPEPEKIALGCIVGLAAHVPATFTGMTLLIIRGYSC